MYEEAFLKSLDDLKKNPLILLPDFLMFFISLALTILFLKYSGILELITSADMLMKELTVMIPTIKEFFKDNVVKITLSFLAFVVTSFLIGSGFTAMKFGMMKQVTENKKPTFRGMIGNGKYAFQVISMKMVMFVIGTVSFLFISGSFLILRTIMKQGYAIALGIVIFPLFIIALEMMLLFRYQIMLIEKKHTITAVKDSFYHFLGNKKHVFMVWLITILASLMTVPISIYLAKVEQQSGIMNVSLFIVMLYIIRSILKLLISIWTDMFKFRTYNLNAQ